MASIAAYRVTNFSGGIRRDKSAFELQKNELADGRNIEIADRGRIITRRGGHQFGNTLSGTIENSFFFVGEPGGGTPSTQFIVNNNASTGVLSKMLRPGYLATALTTASTTVVLDSGSGTTPLAASGTIEIEGDLISYTAKSGDNVTLTGVTGISSSHAVGAAVHQWSTISQSGTALDAQLGVTYAVIGGILILAGRGGNIKQMAAGGTVTEISSEPSIINVTNFNDRIYGMGDGSASNNGSPVRVSYSARGDGTSWNVSRDYFDVYDQSGEYLMAFKVMNDRLGIFKTNSIFTYDEVQLKQRISDVGAYNQKVVQEVNGRIYTFCPDGIFETNLFEAKSIGDPVREYWENFAPLYDTNYKRVCTNTWGMSYRDSYLLYIGDITSPSIATDVVLEFNTANRSWTVHQGGFTNFAHLNGLHEYSFGDSALNFRSALFGGDSSGKVWRLYENRYTDSDLNNRGGDLFQDLVSNTGSPVQASFETGMYDLSYPELFKTFKNLRILAERGQWTVEYRVENEHGITAYKPVGTTTKSNHVLPMPGDAQGYRIGLRISSVNINSTNVFNGFVFEDTVVSKRS